MRRGEDPESLHAAQKLAAAEEERLGVDAATLAIVEDELPIAERMKKKRRRTTTEHPTMLKKRRRPRNLEEMKSPEAAEQPRGPPSMSGFVFLPLVCYPCFGLCMYCTAGLG